MASRTKTKPRNGHTPRHDQPPIPEMRLPEELAADPLFLSHIRQSAVTAAEKDSEISTGRAAGLIAQLDDEILLACIKECGLEADPLPQDHNLSPVENDSNGDENVAAAATEDANPPAKGIGTTLLKFIMGMDPAVRKKIVDMILKLIGVKE